MREEDLHHVLALHRYCQLQGVAVVRLVDPDLDLVVIIIGRKRVARLQLWVGGRVSGWVSAWLVSQCGEGCTAIAVAATERVVYTEVDTDDDTCTIAVTSSRLRSSSLDAMG